MVQCGDPTGTGRGSEPGYTIADELPAAGAYKIGSLAMANTGQPNTGGSQFFLITGSRGWHLPPSYSLFGQVTDGLDTTVKALEAASNPADGVRRCSRSSSNRSPSPKPESTARSPRQVAVHLWPTCSQTPSVCSRAAPLGSSTSGVLASFRVRCRRSADHVSASVTNATPATSPSPRVKAPPRGSTIGSHIAAALPPVAGDDAAVGEHLVMASQSGVAFNTDRR